MDFTHRVVSKTGGGGLASASETAQDRRERLRKLALESIDLNKDPYFLRNHLGTYECKLCLTVHSNEGSYLAHTQGKKHQDNLKKRIIRESKDSTAITSNLMERAKIPVKRFIKIGRPGYKVTKQYDANSDQFSLLFQVDFFEIGENITPRHRFMSSYEQRIEPPEKAWQYLLFAGEPYETIAFKIPSDEIDKAEGKFWTYWNKNSKQFFLQLYYKNDTHTVKENASKGISTNDY